MNWPTPQDYNEAVQNPGQNFCDPDLRLADVDCDKFGLPRPITGGFATVYRFKNNDSEWAVRCFLRQQEDLAQRYKLISDCLSSIQSHWTVSFTFVDKGIRVHDSWFPILKMEWQEGLTLADFIDEKLKRSEDLRGLPELFKTTYEDLKAKNVAHGDLQHGNIIVTGGSLKLVDYDGMFVPSMLGLFSNELGHRNYQHPGRNKFHFEQRIDNFSAWIIWSSLELAALDPNIWRRLHQEPDSLIFGSRDYTEPDRSPTFLWLENHENERVVQISRALRWLSRLAPDAIPPLSEKLLELPLDLPPVIYLPEYLEPDLQSGSGKQAAIRLKQRLSEIKLKVQDPLDQGIQLPSAPGAGNNRLTGAGQTQPPAQRTWFEALQDRYPTMVGVTMFILIVAGIAAANIMFTGLLVQPTLSESATAQAQTLEATAQQLFHENRLSEAAAMYEQALATIEKVSPNDTRRLAKIRLALGTIYTQDDNRKGVWMLAKAMGNYKQLGDNERLAEATHTYAWARFKEKHYAEAAARFTQEISLLRLTMPDAEARITNACVWLAMTGYEMKGAKGDKAIANAAKHIANLETLFARESESAGSNRSSYAIELSSIQAMNSLVKSAYEAYLDNKALNEAELKHALEVMRAQMKTPQSQAHFRAALEELINGATTQPEVKPLLTEALEAS